MQGQRLRDGFTGNAPEGAFWKDDDGVWHLKSPNGRIGTLGNEHTVVEHDDGTITVSPSLKIDAIERPTKSTLPAYHGMLERGVWRDI